jgi:cytochrome c nitrite reductase small subunit
MKRSLWRTAGLLSALRFLGPRWRLPAFLALGVALGAGVFVFHISRAASYLSDRPETCMNCHVMSTEYVSWQHSSHAETATCNDCHVPHDTMLRQYGFKAKDGLWHATVFTMRWEPQVIRLSQGAVPVVESNCRRCHEQVVEDVAVGRPHGGDLRCWDCHRETPHGRVHSLAATPGVFQPRLPGAPQPVQEPKIGGRPIRPLKERAP